jgi:uridine kinase
MLRKCTLEDAPSLAVLDGMGIIRPLNAGFRGTSVPPDSDEGREVYRRSLVLALELGCRRVFPESRLWVEHAVSLGYRCRLEGHAGSNMSETVEKIERAVRDVVREAIPYGSLILSSEEALALSDEPGLLARWHKGTGELHINTLCGYSAFAMGPALPDTSWLTVWELRPVGGSFVLRFPGSASWPAIAPWHERSKLGRELDLEERHLGVMRSETVDRLNRRIRTDGGRELVMMCHFYQNSKMVQIVDRISDQFPRKRIVMVAGPSSSGKTTFTRMLATYLGAMGFRARMISVDNYFKNRIETPKNPDGSYNFESLEALDTELFSGHLKALLDGDEIRMPRFNFHTGVREDGVEPMLLGDNDILLVEGIHGLNDMMTPGIAHELKFLIYISALTTLNIDRLTRMSTSDGRLLRRMVRDSFSRGYTASQTIAGWPSVRRGEREYIFPFQEEADLMFNSALPYETAALKPYAEPLLKQVPQSTPEYHTAQRLLRLLACVEPINEGMIPRLSIIREFINGLLLDWEEQK